MQILTHFHEYCISGQLYVAMSRVQSSAGLSIFKPNNGKNDEHLYMHNVVYKEVLSNTSGNQTPTSDQHDQTTTFENEVNIDGALDELPLSTCRTADIAPKFVSLLLNPSYNLDVKLGIVQTIEGLLEAGDVGAFTPKDDILLKELRRIALDVYWSGNPKNYHFISKISFVAKHFSSNEDPCNFEGFPYIQGNGRIDLLNQKVAHIDQICSIKKETTHFLFRDKNGFFELEFDTGKKIKTIGNVHFDNCQLLYINNVKVDDFSIEEKMQHLQMHECLKIVLQHDQCDFLHNFK